MKDYEVDYEEFWKPILETDGLIYMDQLKRELFDFHRLMKNARNVYDYVTAGRISNPMTDPDVIKEAVRELVKEEFQIEYESRLRGRST